MSKTMTSKLSNAVLHMSLWSLGVFLHPCKIEDFIIILNEKVIFSQNRWNIKKIMNIEWDVTFDLGWLYTWLTRRWKAPNLQFSKNFFWVPFGVPRLAVKSHLYALLIYFLFKNWNELDEFKDNMGTIMVPKKICCNIWNQRFQTPYFTCKYKILARSYNILKFDVFAWFQGIKKHSQFKFVKTHAKHQASKYCKILLRFYTYMWDMAFEGFDFKFCNTNFLGTTMVPILS